MKNFLNFVQLLMLLSVCELACGNLMGQDSSNPPAQIRVEVRRVLHDAAPYLTGACIEDVNHEIYGGIYSQMVFGESFQEPAISSIANFRTLGGQWRVEKDELLVHGKPGDKLISDLPDFADGEVGLEVFIANSQSWNTGLIVRVGNAKAGMDTFDGYEISLNAAAQKVLLGRHRHNWEPIQEYPCPLPIGQWVSLKVGLAGSKIEISVDGKLIATHVDDQRVLPKGTVGIRQFQTEGRYRNLCVKTTEKNQTIPFKNETTERTKVSGMWRAVQAGSAVAEFHLSNEKPWVGAQSQQLTFHSGTGEVGIENQGLNRWGMHFEAGKPYEGTLVARSEKPTEVEVAIESQNGERVLAMKTLQVPAGNWNRIPFELLPNATEKTGRLKVSLRKPSSVTLGYASLQPGDWGRFHGLPIRKDVAEKLIEQGIRVLRYGGSMINHPEYRWKKMIGPREQRPPHVGTWYPYSTNGWGIIDFLDLCEAAGFLSIPDFNIDETPEDMGHFIEYVNGSAASEWGKRREEAGHPQPYGLRYLQLGNEERVDETYFRKFKPIAEAIWERDPNIILVVGDFAYGEPIVDPYSFQGSPVQLTTLAAHEQILQLAKEHGREVWFDVHVDTDGPIPRLGGTMSYIDALKKISGGAKHRVVIFEFNSGNHSQRRALANAAAINIIEADGRIPIALAANCLQPDQQNDNDWNQGLLFLNPSQVWLQPPGYVTQMFANHYLAQVVACDVQGDNGSLSISAKRSQDGKKLTIQVVNRSSDHMPTSIQLDGFEPTSKQARITELSGPLNAVNTAATPKAIIPTTRDWDHNIAGGRLMYRFPGYSVTMMSME